MMFDTVEIDGKEYHAKPREYDSETGAVLVWDLIFDENGEMIPAHTCLCFAHSASECCCGAWYRDNLIHYKEN
jgi:hypothetical protein